MLSLEIQVDIYMYAVYIIIVLNFHPLQLSDSVFCIALVVCLDKILSIVLSNSIFGLM